MDVRHSLGPLGLQTVCALPFGHAIHRNYY